MISEAIDLFLNKETFKRLNLCLMYMQLSGGMWGGGGSWVFLTKINFYIQGNETQLFLNIIYIFFLLTKKINI